MQGHRWKQVVKLRKNPYCPRFLGQPESDFSSNFSTMTPRLARPVYTLAETLVPGPGETLSGEDVDYYFVQCRKDSNPLEFYYRDLSGVYGGPEGTSGREPYNKQNMHRKFLNAPWTRYPCTPL